MYPLEGNQVASSSDGNTVCVWNAKAGVEVAITDGNKHRLSTSPRGDLLASASRDSTMQLWVAKPQ
jgi:WD40 repeat protein